MEYLVLFLLIINFIGVMFLFIKIANIKIGNFYDLIDSVDKKIGYVQNTVKDEMVKTKEEIRSMMQEQRKELSDNFKQFTDTSSQRIVDISKIHKDQLDSFGVTLANFLRQINETLDSMRIQLDNSLKLSREELSSNLKGMLDTVTKVMGEMGYNQKVQLEKLSENLSNLSATLELKFDKLKESVGEKLDKIREDNSKQLDQMRITVDEKLQGTLEKRLGESFRLVSERLEQVYKGLGEMQSLASGVGDLKKVLTNVKSRGILGEIQLEQMLDQVLTPEQYLKNVSTKGNNEKVEFALKLPGKIEDKELLLPIDAKFPLEDYNRLLNAFDLGDVKAIESASKELELRIKASAEDIYKKYINPPVTTDFAVMYLPVEGLFAEVVRRPGLIDTIQRDYKVVIAGPTTLWAVLNSLQMGFRTLAIEKRSSEVWNLLAAVKTEWSKYGEVLDQVKKKLEQATDTIDKVRIRSNIVGKKLKNVEQLPLDTAKEILELDEIEEQK